MRHWGANEVSLPTQKSIQKAERVVAKGYGILALFASIPAVLLTWLLFSVRGEFKCTRNTETGVRICEEHLALRGWEGLPLEAIASAGATGLAVYTTRRKWAEKVGKIVTGEKLDD